MPGGAWEGSAWRKEKNELYTQDFVLLCVLLENESNEDFEDSDLRGAAGGRAERV